MKKFREQIKLTNLLLTALQELKKNKLRQIQTKLEEFSNKCTEVTKNSHIFYAAIEKNWFRSAEKIRSRVSRDLNDFSYQLQRFKEFINGDEIKLANLADIFAGLMQLEDEFGELNFDLNASSFDIKLFISEISKLYSESPYKVIALEPNPAATDCNVTHPHVSSEGLCEGEGHISIRRAIEQGRLCDFFTMVVNILQTYNPDSPYVSLDDWHGISCYDCGYTVAGDECYYCEDCQRDYCSQCSTYCQICDTTVCMGCSFECPGCNKFVCQHCTTDCAECREIICNDCVGEDGLCENCQEQRRENKNEKNKEKSTSPEANPAAQPNSVGQAAVHA
jgi:hypothetical protein